MKTVWKKYVPFLALASLLLPIIMRDTISKAYFTFLLHSVHYFKSVRRPKPNKQDRGGGGIKEQIILSGIATH